MNCTSRLRSLLPVLAVSFAAGCSLSGAGDEARISLQAWLHEPLAPSMLQVTIADGRRHWILSGADFKNRGGAQYDGPTFRTAMRGTLTVRYTLAVPGGRELSAGGVDLDLRKDWAWGLTIRSDTADPRRLCFGCMGSRAFGLDPTHRSTAADSVYVVWGGNSIKNPVVY